LDFAKKEYPNSLNILMRLIDDYLLITTEKEVASKFLEKMLACSKENDFSFNESKITTNFSYVYNGKNNLINSQNFENSLLLKFSLDFKMIFKRILYMDWKNNQYGNFGN